MNGRTSIRARWSRPVLFFLSCGLSLFGASTSKGAGTDATQTRPSIWTTPADHGAILQKIATQEWAKAQFEALRDRSTERVAQHQADADAYLRALPWIKAEGRAHPTLEPITGDMASKGAARSAAQTTLQTMVAHAIDCGVLYYLTEDPAYAAVCGDVLQAVVQGMHGLTPSTDTSNGGWLYPGDHLYEARILGAQLPILYDFAASYLRQPGVKVWDLASRQRVFFDFTAAQEIFRTYTRLAVEHGMSDSNWPVLEMPSLTHNALALDDAAERAHWLSYVTHVDTGRQDPLNQIVRVLNEVGGVWPESFQYANDVAAKVTYIVTLLQRQSGDIELPADVANVSRSMLRLRDFRFPNGDLVRFGDGMRRTGLPFREVEMAYVTAARNGDKIGMAEFGGVVRAAMEAGTHDRAKLGALPNGANVYLSPLSLLWFSPEIEVPARIAPPLPVTDRLPFAGLVLQRNLAPDDKPEHGLMATVHGAAFIHGHASGMSLELYGAGHVLATNAGKGTYRSDEHVNYRRLFAAHNSVIVNGSSSTSGGWLGLGTDTVTPVAMEPAPRAAAASPRHSFTITRFIDRQISGTKAEQERTVGIVRTSDRGGYYVDIFRSRLMDGAQADQFHDYVFHQVGDQVEWRAENGPLTMSPAPDRFQPAPGTRWEGNRSFLYPGWHFLKEATVATSPAPGLIVADFFASKLGEAGTGACLHVPAAPGREYAQAMAPATYDSRGGYDKLATPVAVIRQKGEAWDRPFAAVYEPYTGKDGGKIIRDVRVLESEGKVAGLIVDGATDAGAFRHYVLTPAPAQTAVRVPEMDLHFVGRYAWVALDPAGDPTEIYIGQGTGLKHRGVTLRGADGKAFSARAVKTPDGWKITSPNAGEIVLTGDPSPW